LECFDTYNEDAQAENTAKDDFPINSFTIRIFELVVENTYLLSGNWAFNSSGRRMHNIMKSDDILKIVAVIIWWLYVAH